MGHLVQELRNKKAKNNKETDDQRIKKKKMKRLNYTNGFQISEK